MCQRCRQYFDCCSCPPVLWLLVQGFVSGYLLTFGLFMMMFVICIAADDTWLNDVDFGVVLIPVSFAVLLGGPPAFIGWKIIDALRNRSR